MNASEDIPQLTILSLYNPPTTFSGLEVLYRWLQTESTRQTPTLIMMDSNLHHPLWNPTKYYHTHSQARDLIKACGKKGFRLISPKQCPTFLGSVGRPTTIDLTWANHKTLHLQPATQVQLNNHSSDHHPILTRITPPTSTPRIPEKHLSMSLKNLNPTLFLHTLRLNLPPHETSPLETPTDPAKDIAQKITNALTTSYTSQGRWVTSNPNRCKPWWDKEQLNELVKARNQARRTMLKYQNQSSKEAYYECQQRFKQKVWELKSNHWKRFLAEKGPDHAYQAYRFTRNKQNEEITPLKNGEGNLTSDVTEKSDLLFHGTSIVDTTADLRDIPIRKQPNRPTTFPLITEDEIENAIAELPNKKAPGPDGIPNELIKISKPLLTMHLLYLYNACLRQGNYPSIWKETRTAIIRKAAKDDYTDPNAYRPIALLDTLGKLFEKIINRRLTHWAHQTNTIHPGHVGGRPGRSINDAFVTLTSWIHHKWREGKMVMGIFLDVKSAYPLVQKARLIHILEKKGCPPYLSMIIDSFLSDRTTRLKLNNFVSQKFQIPNGLPQGSPLSVTLYLLYNSDLLLPNPPALNEDSISLAYIDDVTHLLAITEFKQGEDMTNEVMSRSRKWGSRYGAIFDEKKTNFMLFTKKRQQPSTIMIAGLTHTLKKEVRWLGVTITPTLSPGSHQRTVRAKVNDTIGQLNRIIRPTFGLRQKEARTLIAAVISTRILHGSIIWYTTRNKKTIETQLDNWFFRAVRLSTGMMKQTPTPFLKLFGGIKDLTKQHIKLTHNYLHSKMTAPIDDIYRTLVWKELTSSPRSHPSPLNSLLERHTFLQQHSTRTEFISPFPVPPWSSQITNLINVDLTKDEAKEEITNQLITEEAAQSLIIFADGSLIPGKGGGAAAVVMNTRQNKTSYVGRDSIITNFETELTALSLCQDLLAEHIDTHSAPPAVAIFSDSQAALKSVTLPKKGTSGQQLATRIYNRFRHWSTCFPIRLYWCPGHLGIQQNEEVDKLAKEATSSNTISPNTLHHISLSKLKQTTNQQSKTPPTLTPTEIARVKFKTSPNLIIQALDGLEKGPASTIHQLRSNHIPLNAYLHRIKQVPSPRCPHCNAQDNISHYLLYCNKF
ncbi:hypothetical protein O181_039044 [Austropuccinia psidii MF-1]|uniref:RNase H type-1 domain-containing protein n=1 Tax=Austropuccinia psidii MF-1 TaxID=1389203 RepID=A0A9Q3HE58_9BASI|nr:hypothetical protein [Austropuccinia psidii MF-1]